jgi:hypothetical protein
VGSTTSRARGGQRCCGPRDNAGHRRRGLRNGVGVQSAVGSGRTMLLQAQERRRRLGDNACVVDSVTSSGRGRWRHIRASIMVGNDGAEAPWRTRRWCRGSGEVDDGVGSSEFFCEKFWQLDSVSERLRRLGFTKATQRFVYRGTTVATCISDIIGAVATENHSSDGPLPSSCHC